MFPHQQHGDFQCFCQGYDATLTAESTIPAAATAVQALATADEVTAPAAGQVINGSAGNDSLEGDAGDDTLVGMGGDDTLAGAGGTCVRGSAPENGSGNGRGAQINR